MSSTTEWRKLADDHDSVFAPEFAPFVRALLAACDAIDELEGLRKASGMGASLPCMHCAGVFKEWRKVQARVVELENQKDTYFRHEGALVRASTAMIVERAEKAEASLKVAVGALQHYDQWLSDVAEGDLARETLAKLKGEP